MAQGEFTKEETRSIREAVDEIMKALPNSKKVQFLGHFNDIYLFLTAAEKAAPSEKK